MGFLLFLLAIVIVPALFSVEKLVTLLVITVVLSFIASYVAEKAKLAQIKKRSEENDRFDYDYVDYRDE